MTIHPSFKTLEEIVAETAALVRPPERLTVSQAAAKIRFLNNAGAYVGPWKNEITPYLVEPQDVLSSQEFTGMVFVGPAQTGKALALDTKLPTPSGWTTMGEVRIGDQLFGPSGKPVRVVAASEVFLDHDCFRVDFDDGSSVVADAGHRWTVSTIDGFERTLTTAQMAQEGVIRGNRGKFRIPVTAPLELPEQDLLLDPYVLGYWLGDGSERNAYISVGREDKDSVLALFSARGYRCRVYEPSAVHRCYALAVNGPDGVYLDQYLSTLGLGGGLGKRVPLQYLRGSVEQRRELLRGLLDSDGHAGGKNGHTVQFSNGRKEIIDAVMELAAGLGLKPRLTYRTPKKEAHAGSWIVTFTVPDGTVFALPRKRAAVLSDASLRPEETRNRFVRAVVPVPSVPTRCVAVDSDDHLYLAGERMIATHNTDMALNWIAHSVVYDPADIMIVQTSNTTARDFSIRRVDRLHRHSPEVGSRLIARKDADNKFDKMYASGMLLTLSWPTINELSGKPIPRLWLTDYDRMTQDVDGEGSPFDLARKRATTFGNFGMCAAESSPGFMVSDPKWRPTTPHEAPPTQGILALYNRGDRRRWMWRCVMPGCGLPFEPDFSLLNFPDSADAMEAAEMATMRCPHCGTDYSHDPTDGLPGKHEMNRNGRWVRDGMSWTADGRMVGKPIRSSIASFWLKGTAAAFSSWKTLVFNYLSAMQELESTGQEEALKTTVNTDQGLPYVPRALDSGRSPQDLEARAIDIGMRVVPLLGRFLVACIDVQKNRFVVQVHAICENRDIAVIDRFEIKKSERRDEDGERLWVNPGAHAEDWRLLTSEVMLRTYPLADGSGRRMAVHLTVCDSGGKEGVTANAYSFYRWLKNPKDETEVEDGYSWEPNLAPRFLLLKGASSPGAPRLRIDYPDSGRKDRSAGARGEIPVGFMNTQTLKDQLNHMLDRTEPGGRLIFPNWLDATFFTELTVEVKDPKKGWINPRSYRNESWDLLVYCLAACMAPRVRLDTIRFDDPPTWAERWDDNSLVYSPVSQAKPFDAERKPRYDLAKLAQDLG